MCCSIIKGSFPDWTLTNFDLFSPTDSILAEAKNLSFNATAAFKAYSNIKANVDAAEKEAKAAKQSSSEALALVSGHFHGSAAQWRGIPRRF